jgi:hypothetical protein
MHGSHGFAALIVLCVCGAATAQQPIPRTAKGQPDFQGVWQSAFLTPMERIEGASGLVVGDEEAGKLVAQIRSRIAAQGAEADPNVFDADLDTLMRVSGEWRTSMVTEPGDGKVPYAAGVREKVLGDMRASLTGLKDDPETRPEFERCFVGTGRVPFVNVNAHNLRQIVQTPDQLVIYTEEGGDVRIIGIGKARRPSVLRNFYGDSVARWDGDALVIETQHLRPWSNRLVSVSENSTVIERLSFIAPDEILYRFTVEDPGLYATPWSAEFSLSRTPGPAFEYGCHSGNYSLTNVLRSGREADRKSPRK